MPSQSLFADDVKNLRNKLGLSQKALAQALGVSYATINRWEMGRTEPHYVVREHFESFKAKMTKKEQGRENQNQ